MILDLDLHVFSSELVRECWDYPYEHTNRHPAHHRQC